MGEVYRARDTRLGRDVAIKILPQGQLLNADRRSRFLQEARAASALNHPNIVVLYDLASDNGTDYLVMEYVSGNPLETLIAAKRCHCRKRSASRRRCAMRWRRRTPRGSCTGTSNPPT